MGVGLVKGGPQWVVPGHDQSLSAIKSTEPTYRPPLTTLKTHYRLKFVTAFQKNLGSITYEYYKVTI